MKRSNAFKPVVVYDAMSYMRQYWLAVEQDGEDIRLIISDTTRHYLHAREVLLGQIGLPGHKTRLVISEKDPHEVARGMKLFAMKWGATPEAVRLLGKVCPLTDEEEHNMPKLARKDELKAAAKEAPVAKKTAAAAKPRTANGQEDVFEEARTARREAMLADKRKIVATDKGKAKLAKVDDEDKLSIMITARTVGAAIETEEVSMRDINYAEKIGLVDLV